VHGIREAAQSRMQERCHGQLDTGHQSAARTVTTSRRWHCMGFRCELIRTRFLLFRFCGRIKDPSACIPRTRSAFSNNPTNRFRSCGHRSTRS
jgi:hypothetical protein